MSDEQMIFLDPDDDLNRVTERLTAATRQRVTLIVPPQTQMRSNVFWRLLFSRAREMGRDVTVVSADRQVRSVAKIAGFRTDDAPDTSASGKGRSGLTGRTIRSQLESRLGNQQPSQPARHTPRRSGALSRNSPGAQLNNAQGRASQQRWRESVPSPEDKTFTGQESMQNIRDFPAPQIEGDDYDRPYEFRIGASQATPLSPSAARQEEREEQDPYMPDYERSRSFLQSWQSGQVAPPALPVQPEPETQGERTIEFPLSPAQYEPTSSAPGSSALPRSAFPERNMQPPDPFDEFDDQLLAPLPEQRGSAFVKDIDDDVPDITDKPAEVAGGYHIEDLGEDEEEASPAGPQRQWPELLGDDPEEYEPRRVYGSRPRSSRAGSRRPARGFYDEEEAELASIDNRPTGPSILPVQPIAPAPMPQQPSRQTDSPAAARATAGAAAQPQRPQHNVNLPPGALDRSNRPGVSPAQRPVPRPAAKPRSSQRGSRALVTLALLLLVLFLVGVGLFYYGTSATITVTVPWQTLSKSKLTLVATTNPQNKTQNTVDSQVLSFTASASGTVPATGTTPQGSTTAQGNATFSNNGAVDIDIPIHTIISTSAGTGTLGILFVTQADALVLHSSSVQIPITAKSAGVGGNVGAGKISVIPADSLTAIAAVNHVTTASLNLSVTNPNATTGGGVINVPAATKNDIAALKLKLHQQIQTQVKNWLQTQLHSQDQRGSTMPDVLSSTTPLSNEVLTQAPPVGQALTSSTVQGTLTLQVKLLVVRYAAIQAAAQQQLNQLARKMNPPFTVTTAKSPVNVTAIAGSSSKGGTVLTITYNAVAQIVQYFNTDDLSSYLAGKTVDQAKSSIGSNDAGIQNAQNVEITVIPSFLNILPFRPDHIRIIELPGVQQPSGKPNG